jgi:putative chitinase
MNAPVTAPDILHTWLEPTIASVASRGVNPGLWAQTLDPFMSRYAINTPNRIAAFVGQCAVESFGFSVLEENLNYSAARLCQVWPDHFAGPDSPDATLCARHPARLANIVYANRMGNGGMETGDGWRFRGSGLMQLTGRANFEAFAKATHINDLARAQGIVPQELDLGAKTDIPGVTTLPEYVRTPKGAAESACWFWSQKRLNTLADAWMLTVMSRTINGGDSGLDHRIGLCNVARRAIKA